VDRKFEEKIPERLEEIYEDTVKDGRVLVVHSTTPDGVMDFGQEWHNDNSWKHYLSTSTIGCPKYLSKGYNTVYTILSGNEGKYHSGDIGNENFDPKNTPYDEIELTDPNIEAFIIPKNETDKADIIANTVLAREFFDMRYNRYLPIIDEGNNDITSLVNKYVEKFEEASEDDLIEWIKEGLPEDEIIKDPNVEEFTKERHKGQIYGNGNSYYEAHLVPVKRVAEELGKNISSPLIDEIGQVAILHDILEDTDTKKEELVENYGVEIANSVDLLTKKPGQSPDEYFQKISENEVAKIVKAADRIQNIRELVNLKDEKKKTELLNKYRDQYKYIEKYDIFPELIKEELDKY
jgi:hypothetical protein